MGRVTDHLSFSRPARLTIRAPSASRCWLSRPSPGRGLPNIQLPPEKHAQKVSKLGVVWEANILPFFIYAIAAFKIPNNPVSIPNHSPLDVTRKWLFSMDDLPGDFSGRLLCPALHFFLTKVFSRRRRGSLQPSQGQLRLCSVGLASPVSICEPETLTSTVLRFAQHAAG